jgi:hypothetical protein
VKGPLPSEKSRHSYLSLPNMADLFVEVRDRDIIVRRPETGHFVTYRRVLEKPRLVALDPMREDFDRERTKCRPGKPLMPKQRR